MSSQQRMDAAYGRRGGRIQPMPAPDRPELGPALLLVDEPHRPSRVEIVSVLPARRCRIMFSGGHFLTVPDSLLREVPR